MPAYYLHIDNQVQGPYSKAEVESRLNAGTLQPDTQVCADDGEWRRLADALPTLFSPPAPPASRQVQAPATSQSNQYTAPDVPRSSSGELQQQTSQGIGRVGFLAASAGIVVLGSVLSALMKAETTVATFLTAGLLLIPTSSRLKNIGRNPGWCVLVLIPFLGLFVTVPCFLLPAGYQQHRKLDLPAKVLGGCFLVALVLVMIWTLKQL